MDRPVIRGGAVVFDAATILAVGDDKALRKEHPSAQIVEAGQAVILPGLVNAHAHLELTHLDRPATPPADLASWIIELQSRASVPEDQVAATIGGAVAEGVAQCLRFGVTAVGDISQRCDLTRPLLKDGPVRVVSYGEVLAMGQRRRLLEERLGRAIDDVHGTHWLRMGVSPHAPYSVEPAGFRRCLEEAQRLDLPLATHLAETAEEAEFLASHAGPLRSIWDRVGGFDEDVPTFSGGPIRLARWLGLLDESRTVLAHVNWCDDEELDVLASGRASVVYCPRTHAYFNHPPHRWREMLARGVNVAVGTDSTASSPDLNPVDDLRLLHRIVPEVPPATLWRLATLNAARAVGLDRECGSITPGKRPDFGVFAAGDDPLRHVLENPGLPQQVWTAGRRR